MNSHDLEKYIKIAHSGITAEDFCKHLKKDGLSKFDVFVLLRDGYNLGLAGCMEVWSKTDTSNGL